MWWHRSDGTLVRDLSRTRRVMPYLMRGRNESAVYASQDLSLRNADAFTREWNQANPLRRIDVFHLTAWGLRDAMMKTPGTNRFVAGGRLYQRKGVWFSYAVKQRLEVGTPMVVLKQRVDTNDSFGEMVEAMYAGQAAVAEGERSTVEKELGLLMVFPGWVRRIIMGVIRWLDRMGMLPPGYVESDPMYASAFFANMASLGMPAVYHHLYEYGTAGVFSSIGKPVPEPDSPTSGPDRRRRVTVKWTFDERTDDGLAAWYAMRRVRQIVEDPIASGMTVEALPGGGVPAPHDEGSAAPVES